MKAGHRCIEQEILEEKKEIEVIEKNISYMREKLLEKIPSRFSKRDVINAFFGSLILGLTFVLKGQTVGVAASLSSIQLIAIVAITLAILMAEIYFIGYSRVRNKSKRRFGQFMTKRLVALYGVTLFVSFGLIYTLNINNSNYVNGFYDVIKIAVLMSFPCAVGAAVPSLLKQY